MERPIPQVHFMKLIPCSLNNSWDTLKNESIAIMEDVKTSSADVQKISPGHYNLENLAKLITTCLAVF